MRKLFTVAIFAGLALAQSGKAPASPARTAELTVGGQSVATITYSSPSVRGRKIFGPSGLLAKDSTYPVWRAGANAATALHTTHTLKLGGLSLAAGDYTLYVLVADPDHWQLIVNKQTGQWGLSYDPKQDLGRTPMTMSVPAAPVEQLVYTLTPTALILAWDGHMATVPLAMR
ncbi:MAG TPA: DUF2911 domain-containing protein [Terriglobales bacterium]|nr:DUF2911 domain-containing protein [Terriglobales bacterium]